MSCHKRHEALEAFSRERDINFSVRNSGEHVILVWDGGRAEYWPSTKRAIFNGKHKSPRFLSEKQLCMEITKHVKPLPLLPRNPDPDPGPADIQVIPAGLIRLLSLVEFDGPLPAGWGF